MPQTKTKPNAIKNKSAPNSSLPGISATTEILTLAEAAAYLRLPQDAVLRLVHHQGLPGRPAGTEWRFLKAAIQDWLRSPPLRPSKEAVMSRIGNWKDDPYLDDE